MKIVTETQVLNNSKIILRKFRESDLEQLSRITSDQNVMEYIGGAKSSSETRVYLTRLIEKSKPSAGMYALIYKPTMEFAGIAGFITNETSYLQLHVAIMKMFQRRGLAKEAFTLCLNYANDVLNETTVIVYIKSGNRIAKKVLRKMDFKFKKIDFMGGKSQEMYMRTPSFLMN